MRVKTRMTSGRKGQGREEAKGANRVGDRRRKRGKGCGEGRSIGTERRKEGDEMMRKDTD